MGLDWVYQESPRNRLSEKAVPHDMMQLSDQAKALKQDHDNHPLTATNQSTLTQTPMDPMPRKTIIPTLNLNHPAYGAQTLAELKTAIEAFEGCELKKSATHTVFSDGNPEADIMLIGEAPGAEEDLQGKPFVGMSGQLLDKMMQAIGLDRSRIYISNIIPWRPPGNRPPSTQEIATCLPFIEHHVLLKKPKYLLLLGGVATKSILNTNEGIMRLRGHWQNYKPPHAKEDFPTIRALPTFHPAFLLRSPGQKVYAWEDLKTLKAALDSLD